MRVLLLGGSGQLGSEIKKLSPYEIISPSHEELSLGKDTDESSILIKYNPDLIINCAAMHNVQGCQTCPQLAFRINSISQYNLAKSTASARIPIVFISTNYVFDGAREAYRGYTELDGTSPLSVYGKSKLAGELVTQALNPKHLIIRTSYIFGVTGPREKKYNLIDNLVLSLKGGKEVSVKDDTTISPTYAPDLAKKILDLIEGKNYGVYHVANNGALTIAALAEFLASELNLDPALIKHKKSTDFPLAEVLPKNATLSSIYFEMPMIFNSIRKYLKEKSYARS